ncbi:uncharacterized protein LOC109716414 [Ananas comosus]|uniref:Uncharacterized protein LOC109716414 n=1 Tax=Ananas comosus TaxID=4615 RepID=A0A6P5FVB7_ANACO|nr:uncharacterized protein LOC109716414 [Ananas comosus]
MAFLLPLTEIAPIRGAKTPPNRRSSSCGSRSRAERRGEGARVCVRGRVKGEEKGRVIRVSDPIREPLGLAPLFSGSLLRESSSSSPSSPPSLRDQQREAGDDKQDYYVNLGYAIRTLREEFPDIFYKEPKFDIYRDDIVFKDPLNTFVGVDSYKRIFWALRFNGRIFFKALWIDIVSVWQPVENVIMIRWIVHGIPRVPWESHGRFDGTSEYKLDKNGKIYEHRVDNVALNSPTKFRVLPVEELIRSLGCPSTPKPTYFETSLLFGFLLRFTWTRCYLTFYLTLSFVCAAEG